ncbi:MAG: hypothetical protein H7840_05405 [Alphaproteobacteria bacterium]
MLPGELWVCTLGEAAMVAVALRDDSGKPVLVTCQRPIILTMPRGGGTVTMHVVRHAPGGRMTVFEADFQVHHHRMVDLTLLRPLGEGPAQVFEVGTMSSRVVGEPITIPGFSSPGANPVLWESRIFERQIHQVQLDYSLYSRMEVLTLHMDSDQCLPGSPVLHDGHLVGIYAEHRSNANFQSLAKLEFRTPITFQSLDFALCLSVRHVREFLADGSLLPA